MTIDETQLDGIRANAALVIEELSKTAERQLGYDRASVEWVEGFIERQRTIADAATRDQLVSVLGSYLGEAIRETANGTWHDVEAHGLGVRFPNDQVCFPFNKVAKQFESGTTEGESIASFYDVCVNYIATGKLDAATDGAGGERSDHMKSAPGIGETHTLDRVVTKRMTVPELIPDSALIESMPAVLATPNMIALMELACTELLAKHVDAGEGSLGAHVDVSHIAATLAGQSVTITAKVAAVEGRKVTFDVTAHDGVDTIGAGRHIRMVVPWNRFEAKVNQKAKVAGVEPLSSRERVG